MVGLPCGEKNYDNIYQTVSIEYWYETDGQTDGRTKLLYQYRASVC